MVNQPTSPGEARPTPLGERETHTRVSLRPMVIPLDSDLIPSFSRDDPDGGNIIVIQRILVSSRRDGFGEDVGRT